MEESHGRQLWVEDGFRRAHCFSRVTSSRLRNDPSLSAGNQPKVAQVHKMVPIKLEHQKKRVLKKERGQVTRRNTKSLSEHAGTGTEKPEYSKTTMSRDMKSSRKHNQISFKRQPTECGSAVEHRRQPGDKGLREDIQCLLYLGFYC